MEGERQAELKRGPHQSATEHTPFLREEFASMVEKGQWVVLPILGSQGADGTQVELTGREGGAGPETHTG